MCVYEHVVMCMCDVVCVCVVLFTAPSAREERLKQEQMEQDYLSPFLTQVCA